MRSAICRFLAIVGAVLGAPAAAAVDAIAPNGLIDIAYVAPRDPAFQHYYVGLQRLKVLEELQAFLSPLELPGKISIRVDQCDAPNRVFRPGEPVVICYEYVDRLNQLAARIPADGTGPLGVSRDDAIVGAFIQATLQHTASAVFDALGTPIWGREQDAADKLAAFLMMQFGPQVGRKLMTGAAYFFLASDRTWTGVDFSDVEGTESQRYYNYLCVAYGFDKRLFGDFYKGVGNAVARVAGAELPTARAAECGREYEAIRWAFYTLILPHVDSDKLSAVMRLDWLHYNAQ